jgi:di/tripeptidase
MKDFIEKIETFPKAIKSIRETIITNLILLGQIPAPTYKERRRANFFMERLAEFQVDECTTDGYRNPIGIIRGTSSENPAIFLVAHLDTIFSKDIDHNFTVRKRTITGPGIMDNSVGVGVLMSIPEILKKLDLKFESDIVLAGVIQSIGKGNLRGVRHLVKTWPDPIRGAICIEGGEIGRFNYYCDAMIRVEVHCHISAVGQETTHRPNAILVLNEIINEILQLRLPLKPRTKIIIGKISGGFKHGKIAFGSKLGFEIQSGSDKIAREVYKDIQDIVTGMGHEKNVYLKISVISNVHAAGLPYNHPLVKNTVAVMKKLDLKPAREASESELSIFLSRKIPAVTLGITRGNNYQTEKAVMEIEPMFKGIAQILGVMMAIDSGVCDE